MKTFLSYSFAIIAVLLFVFGFFGFIGNIGRSGSEAGDNVVLAIACLVSSVFTFGFSYIVEASIKYLERCQKEEQK